MSIRMNALRGVDFFCGCGGTSAGLRKAGISVLAGIDVDAEAGATFQRNFPEAKFLLQDIQSLTVEDLDQVLGLSAEEPLIFSACAPCQPFSQQKTQKRDRDERRDLLDELHRFVVHFLPDYVFIENVPGLQQIKAGSGPLDRFKALLESLDYEWDVEVSAVQKFGVPQVRNRLVLIASRRGPIQTPSPTHGPGTEHEEYETVWGWIRDLPPLKAGEVYGGDDYFNHVAANLSDLNLARIAATPKGGGRRDWPRHLYLDCHADHSGHTDVYGRLRKDRPASALSTRCISLSNGRYGHPEQDRAISVREAARLQTFDDDFIFEGSMMSMARQIGNAVPVRLAEVFGRHLQEHFDQATSDVESR